MVDTYGTGFLKLPSSCKFSLSASAVGSWEGEALPPFFFFLIGTDYASTRDCLERLSCEGWRPCSPLSFKASCILIDPIMAEVISSPELICATACSLNF